RSTRSFSPIVLRRIMRIWVNRFSASSIRDHMTIIEALEARDTERAEALVREHALGLAEHVRQHASFLD
ncbi:MAG TPA: FCD domain-containing protein, partial [Xanthobacteraceae bacterium]|nr:FCD domain-containing protein [Xanthobacteraceae bacterium]